jgi:hypothetical protein
MVLVQTKLRAVVNKKRPRKVYVFAKGNIEGLKSDVTAYQQVYENHQKTRSVEENWQSPLSNTYSTSMFHLSCSPNASTTHGSMS